MKTLIQILVSLLLVWLATSIPQTDYAMAGSNDPAEPDSFDIELWSNDTGIASYGSVEIRVSSGTGWFGSFDFLIEYASDPLTFANARLGEDVIDCWEYFTYREASVFDIHNASGEGLVRVVGIADINNGNLHPDESCLHFNNPPSGHLTLVELIFRVSSELRYECQAFPIRFYWGECDHNTVTSLSGDTVWLSERAYDIVPYIGGPTYVEVTGQTYYGGHWWLSNCENSGPGEPVRVSSVNYYNSIVDLLCTGSSPMAGDINLNNVLFEVADATLFCSYFIYGIEVFNINVYGQVMMTDVNMDGVTLQLTDFMYLMRLIIGELTPIPKSSPFAKSATIYEGETLTISAGADIGAALIVYDGPGEAELLAEDMKMLSDVVDGRLRVLIWSDKGNFIPAGTHELLRVENPLKIVHADICGYDCNPMRVDFKDNLVPREFALRQNYPNPFNPSTHIELSLPEETDWRIEIFNLAGQMVDRFSGRGVGDVVVEWDARDKASGVYLYRATAGSSVQTRKMMLLK